MYIPLLAERLSFSSIQVAFIIRNVLSSQVMIKQNGLMAVYLVWTCFGPVCTLVYLAQRLWFFCRVSHSQPRWVEWMDGICCRVWVHVWSCGCLGWYSICTWFHQHLHLWFTSAYISQGAEEEWPTEFDPEVLQEFLDGTCLSLAFLIEIPLVKLPQL